MKPTEFLAFLMDVHIHEKNTDLVKDLVQQLIEYCLKNKIDVIIQGGDIFNSRKGQSIETLDCFSDILTELHKNSIRMYGIAGNHDKNDYESAKSYLNVFRYHPSYIYIEDLTSVTSIHNDYNFILLPFFKEDTILYDKIISAISLIKEGKKNILVTHCAIEGVKNNDGSVVNNRITKDMLNKFDKVLVGHYHNEQIFDNVHYMGSFYQANYGEDNKKGFWSLSYDGKFKHIKTKFPEYKKVMIDLDLTTPLETEELIKEYKSDYDNIRFNFKGTKEQLNSIDDNKFKRVGIDVKKESFEIINGIIEAESNEYISFDKSGILEEFETFCTVNNYEDSEVGKNYLIKQLN